MRELFILLLAAATEVGGDAMIRSGLKGRGAALLVAGALTLVAYGFMVNLTKLDFGKLMGLYIVVFFIVAQATSVIFFKERLPLPMIVGGLLIIAGGVTMTVWHAN